MCAKKFENLLDTPPKTFSVILCDLCVRVMIKSPLMALEFKTKLTVACSCVNWMGSD